MLDRVGSDLIYATEALAAEESTVKLPDDDNARIYIPVVVTNANVNVAEFDPTQLDLRTGRVDDGKFTEAGFVRYCKALDPSPRRPSTPRSILNANEMSQRSVFVVNVDSFVGFLGQLAFVQDMWKKFPWSAAKETHARRRNAT